MGTCGSRVPFRELYSLNLEVGFINLVGSQYLITSPVLHGSDSHYFFNDTHVDTQTVGALECGTSLMDYFLSFIDGLDPNDGRGIQRPNWSQYSEHNQVRIECSAVSRC